MVHTAELTYFPNQALIRTFKNLDDTVYYQQNNTWYNERLRENGIRLRLCTINRGVFRSPRLICRVTFNKILTPGSKIELIEFKDVYSVEREFDKLTEALLPILPSFSQWTVNRIDYCINVKTPFVEKYLDLLKKGDRPKLKSWYDHNGNYTQKPGSLYLVGTAKHRKNRSITVNFYNKQDEIMKDCYYQNTDDEWQETEFPYDNLIELAADVLRLEVQCHKPKTDYLKEIFNLPDKSIMNYLSPIISEYVIESYLLRIGRSSDYHRKRVALEMVDHTSRKSKTKDRMKLIIREVAKQYSSIAKVRDKLEKNGVMNRIEFNRILRIMDDENINPVTISDNYPLDGMNLKEGLPNLYGLMIEGFEKQLHHEEQQEEA